MTVVKKCSFKTPRLFQGKGQLQSLIGCPSKHFLATVRDQIQQRFFAEFHVLDNVVDNIV